MSIIKFKGCKRCGGDLYLERDTEGPYISCLQCGAVLVKRKKLEEPAPAPRRSKVLVH